MNKSIRTLLGSNSLILTAMAMFTPLYAIYVQEIDGSILDIGYAWSIYAFAAAITTFVSGK